MVDQQALLQVLAKFARLLVTDYDTGRALDELCMESIDVLGVTGAGVMLRDLAGDLRFAAASDDIIQQVEVLQMALGEGPCQDAWQSSEPTIADDLASGNRWPKFTIHAVNAGMRSVYSFPMTVNHDCFGAFNIYRDHPGHFDEKARDTARLLSEVATSYIFNTREYQKSVKLNEQLQQALTTRLVIEQAKGRIAYQLNLDADTAFGLLRKYARSHNRNLHQVARAVLDDDLNIDSVSPRDRHDT